MLIDYDVPCKNCGKIIKEVFKGDPRICDNCKECPKCGYKNKLRTFAYSGDECNTYLICMRCDYLMNVDIAEKKILSCKAPG
jgi:hypothetical protein